jgi:drug/metabolite transporter (DMT)-like permease
MIGFLSLLAVVELGALYSLQRYAKHPNETQYLVVAMLIFGTAVPLLLLKNLQYDGIGHVNFFWNILSTMAAFAMGIFLFGEKLNQLQLMGVLVALLGVGLVLLNQAAK